MDNNIPKLTNELPHAVYSTPVATNFVLNSKSIVNWFFGGYFIKVHSTYFGVKT